jgi:hypothetical protein
MGPCNDIFTQEFLRRVKIKDPALPEHLLIVKDAASGRSSSTHIPSSIVSYFVDFLLRSPAFLF